MSRGEQELVHKRPLSPPLADRASRRALTGLSPSGPQWWRSWHPAPRRPHLGTERTAPASLAKDSRLCDHRHHLRAVSPDHACRKRWTWGQKPGGPAWAKAF